MNISTECESIVEITYLSRNHCWGAHVHIGGGGGGGGGSSAFPSSLIAMWHCWLLHGFRRIHKQTTPWLYQLTELNRDVSPEQNEQTIRNSWYYMPKVLRYWTCAIDSTAFGRNARLMWYDCSLVRCSPDLSDTFCTLFSPQALDTVLSMNIY